MGNFDLRVATIFCLLDDVGCGASGSFPSSVRFLDEDEVVGGERIGIPAFSNSSTLMSEMRSGIGVRLSRSEEILEKSDEVYEATHPAIAMRSLGS